MKTIVVANEKGGVGKTTTATNLAGAYSIWGKRVLLVDLDPQGNASKTMTESEFSDTSLHVYLNKNPAPLKTENKNIDLLPSNRNLSSITLKMNTENEILFKLKDYLEKVKNDYHLAIVDTPPTIMNHTISGMVCADYLLVPISTNYYSLQGTKELIDSFLTVKENLNPDLKLLGACVTIHDRRTALANQILDRLKENFKDNLFKQIIPKEIKVEEAQVNCKTVVEMFPESKSATAFLNLASEVESKIFGGEK